MKTITINKHKFNEAISKEYADGRSCAFSKVVKLGVKTYKITHDTGNCYSHTQVHILLADGTWKCIATEFDIDGCYINYVADESKKRLEMAKIYNKALEYITIVF